MIATLTMTDHVGRPVAGVRVKTRAIAALCAAEHHPGTEIHMQDGPPLEVAEGGLDVARVIAEAADP
ncbi:MAG TPA: hypothetical protein ENK57_03885 [Polyangiaceae bacterium]|nr:hypothetical protein [Polyangiaceae bacterium]